MKLALSLLALVYFLLPYDFFPDIVIGWGWIDDLIIFYFLWRFFYRGKGWSFSHPQGTGRSNEGAGGNGSPSTSGSKSTDPYDVLQIPKEASQEEIKTAYKHLAGKYHPDKVLHLGEEFQSLAEERFKEIQSAYQKLAAKDGKDRL
jgi:hypothetical protein